jgi:trimeric autotransporter adhesin
MANIKRANTSGITKSGVAIPDVPDAPTVSAANVGTSRAYNNGAATVTFTAAATGGTSTSFTATSTPGSFTATGAGSPLTVTGLQSATSYTFAVTGTNASATGAASAASSSITATTVPQAPTIGTATAGADPFTQASVTFTAGATGGSAITGYTVTSSPGSFTGTGASSPITVSGLANGTAYTFTVTATNANGTSTASAASNSLTTSSTSFDSIATFTPTSGTSVTFSSIPQTYKSLQVRMNCLVSSAASFTFTLNGNTGANYHWHTIAQDTNTQVADGTSSAATSMRLLGTAKAVQSGYPLGAVIDIIDYASTTKNTTTKSFCEAVNNTGPALEIYSGLFRNTSAITSLTINTSTGFATGTSIALYGVK